jgi:putative endonuclease
MKEKHFVYILLTQNDTLYCGYTDDVEKRFKAHQEGRGAKYTKANKPVKVLWQKEFSTKNEALKEEYRIKRKLTRAQKFALIEQKD